MGGKDGERLFGKDVAPSISEHGMGMCDRLREEVGKWKGGAGCVSGEMPSLRVWITPSREIPEKEREEKKAVWEKGI